MLKLYRSTELKLLADKYIEEAGVTKSNPLEPDRVIVQNNQMKRWLQKYVARKTGVAANNEMQFPGAFIWDIYQQIDKDIPDTLPSEREPMQFSIYDVLQSGKYRTYFTPLYDYIENDEGKILTERAWNLSGRIADLFDRYQIYRPDMILKWQSNELTTRIPEEKWQAALWRALQQEWNRRLKNTKEKNRTELHRAFLNTVRGETLSPNNLPNRITVFAVPTLDPLSMETFIELGRATDVLFYWHDVTHPDSNEDPLVKAWGDSGKKFINAIINKAKERGVASKTETIKSSNQDKENHILGGSQSVGVHSCHSPLREVEVLYDQLLARFDDDPELNPDDVLIVSPNIETYAPLIQAVFDTPDDGQPPIPYHIESYSGSADTQAQSFLNLLQLTESRFKVSEVLDLLSSEPVRSAFGLSEEDAARLIRWIDENNIRWGIDASFKEASGLLASNHFTWQAGLNRMMLGTTMEQRSNRLMNDIFPYSEIATSSDTLLVGKFARLLHELFRLHQESETARPIKQWADILKKVAQTFLSAEESSDHFVNILQTIDKFADQQHIAGVDSKIPFKVLLLWLQNDLENKTRQAGGRSRGVTFSSLVASRAIPIKMVGMIGMDDGTFPNKDQPVSFDLMKKKPNPDDPDRLQEDRYLFLETLASAGQYHYFSYVGQSNREDAEFPPSVLISEILDYLREQKDLERDDIIQKHPLQSFSNRYFTDDGANHSLLTYSKKSQNIARELSSNKSEKRSWLGKALPESEEDRKNVTVNELIAYYQNPAKFILKNRLGLFIKDEKITDEDRELFDLRGLDKHAVEQELIQNYLKSHSFDGLEPVLKARDLLPEGWPGYQAFSHKKEEAKEFGDYVLAIKEEQTDEKIEININIAGTTLKGLVSGYLQPVFLDYRFGKRRPKDTVAWWVKHVILSTSNQAPGDLKSVLLTWNDEELEEAHLNPLENPGEILANMIQDYQQGLKKIGYFFPASSFNFAESWFNNGDEKKAMKAARKEWEGNSYQNTPGEKDDRYVKLLTGDKNPLDNPQFKEEAIRFWQPFFNAYE